MAITAMFAQPKLERVFFYPEADSTLIFYSFSKDLTYISVDETGLLIGSDQTSKLKSAKLYWNNVEHPEVTLTNDGAYIRLRNSLIKDMNDFTWEFQTTYGKVAYSLIDQFSDYSVAAGKSNRDPNGHFEVAKENGKIAPKGTIRKK